MRRFEIAQESMLPNLAPGAEVVAVDTRRPRVGDVVVFPHPQREGFWMVKRVAEPPRPIAHTEAWVISDNPEATRADSRTLGPVGRGTMWTVVDRLDGETFPEACALLADEDDHLARLLDTHGMPRFWERQPGFGTLVWLILEQQVSLESGAAMYRRLHEACGGVSPESVAALGRDRLRFLGVTRQKADYIVGLAEELMSGAAPLEALDTAGPEHARSVLLSIRGVGPWTADTYLLSALRHPDVFPVGDRALQVGTAEALGMTTAPDPEELEILSRPWRPIRAAAARMIWHAYLAARGRREPPDPTVAHESAGDA